VPSGVTVAATLTSVGACRIPATALATRARLIGARQVEPSRRPRGRGMRNRRATVCAASAGCRRRGTARLGKQAAGDGPPIRRGRERHQREPDGQQFPAPCVITRLDLSLAMKRNMIHESNRHFAFVTFSKLSLSSRAQRARSGALQTRDPWTPAVRQGEHIFFFFLFFFWPGSARRAGAWRDDSFGFCP